MLIYFPYSVIYNKNINDVPVLKTKPPKRHALTDGPRRQITTTDLTTIIMPQSN